MVKNWPKGERLQRVSPHCDDYFKVYVPEYYDNGKLRVPKGKLIPLSEAQWPKDVALLPMQDGTFFAGSLEELRRAMEAPYQESERDERAEREELKKWWTEDPGESCEICARVPQKASDVATCAGGHYFHADCLRQWREKANTPCPHCRFGFSGAAPACPVAGCLGRNATRAHMRERHLPTECGLCHRRYLAHAELVHRSLRCGDWLSDCPAAGCAVEMTAEMACVGAAMPSFLRDHHDCANLHPCQLCSEVFLWMEDLRVHAMSGACAMDRQPAGRPQRGAKRKAERELQRFSSED